jgi:hemolysin activation/secretion protein
MVETDAPLRARSACFQPRSRLAIEASGTGQRSTVKPLLQLIAGAASVLLGAVIHAADLPPAAREILADGQEAGGEKFVVDRFQFVGNTRVSGSELAGLVSGLTNRPISILELERARVAVTLRYVTNGYVNSGAWIDSRPDGNGTVTVRVVEGRLSELRVRGNQHLDAGFFERRLADLRAEPLQLSRLRDRLQVWRNSYPLKQVNGELRPGLLPGEGVLELSVVEQAPFQTGVHYANDRPPSTGSEQVTMDSQIDSLISSGDRLGITYGVVRGRSPFLDAADALAFDELSVSYAVPVNRTDTTVAAQYSRSSGSVLEARFADLDITSDSTHFGVSVTHPLFRNPRRELSVALAAEGKEARTYLLGEPYSFSPGSVDGKSTVSSLRLSAQWTDRGANHVFVARGAVSLGLPAFGATRQEVGPDGRFVAVLGQAKWVRHLGNPAFEVALRGFGQYSPDSLLAIEQASIGGAATIRGYRENTLVRDNAAMGVIEFGFIPWRDSAGQPVLRLVPFAGIGWGWDNERPTPSPREIASAGVGLVVRPFRHLEGALFWGHAFRDLDYGEVDLQDHGLHFRITAWAF